MTYRERLQRYQNGQCTPEERAFLEEELEKSEAIADYLAGELEQRLVLEAESAGEETQQIRRAVRGRLRRFAALSMGIAAVVVVVAGLAVHQWMQTTNYQTDLVEWDLPVLYELLQPGKDATQIETDSLGFGRYDLSYTEIDWFTGEKQTIRQTIRPGRSSGNTALIEPLVRLLGLAEHGGSAQEEEFLRQLDDMGYVSAWVLFPKDLTPRALAQLMTDYKYPFDAQIQFRWAAVRGADPMATMGFRMDMPDAIRTDGLEDYPLLQYGQLFGDQKSLLPGGNETQYIGDWAQIYTLHFESLLSYAADHPEAVIALAGPADQSQFDFATQQNYVEEHGIQIYGALVYGQPSVLLDLLDQGRISALTIDSVLATRYSGSQSIRQ